MIERSLTQPHCVPSGHCSVQPGAILGVRTALQPLHDTRSHSSRMGRYGAVQEGTTSSHLWLSSLWLRCKMHLLVLPQLEIFDQPGLRMQKG